jgi:predicted Zn-dependent protease
MDRYAGGAFSPQLPGGRGGGELFCDSGRLVFQKDGVEIHFPIEGLHVERGGAGRRLFYFKHHSQPGVVLHTGDETLLLESTLASLPEILKARRGARNTRNSNLAALGSAFAVLLAIPLALWLGQDALISMAVAKIPTSWEEKMGDVVFEQIKSQTKLMEDPELLRRFGELAAPLVTQSKANIRLHIVDDKEINAFALPGGHLVFNRGLLEKASSPDEVLGVLAHEIAHLENRHSLRQIARSLGLYFILQIVIGDFSGALGLIQDGGFLLLQQGYSRSMETEADEVGHAALVRAGLSTSGMLHFFERIKAEDRLQTPALLSTHPATEERIRSIQSLNATAPTGNPVAFDFIAFQKLLKGEIPALETKEAIADFPYETPAPDPNASSP